MKNFYEIKYIPTGLVFSMEKEEIDRLLQEEPENFSVVDADYVKEENVEVKPEIYEMVVEQPKEEVEVPKKKSAKKK